jgi:hypothetical protein
MLKKDSDERLTTSRIKKKVLHLKMDIILHSSIENDLRGLSQFKTWCFISVDKYYPFFIQMKRKINYFIEVKTCQFICEKKKN